MRYCTLFWILAKDSGPDSAGILGVGGQHGFHAWVSLSQCFGEHGHQFRVITQNPAGKTTVSVVMAVISMTLLTTEL